MKKLIFLLSFSLICMSAMGMEKLKETTKINFDLTIHDSRASGTGETIAVLLMPKANISGGSKKEWVRQYQLDFCLTTKKYSAKTFFLQKFKDDISNPKIKETMQHILDNYMKIK